MNFSEKNIRAFAELVKISPSISDKNRSEIYQMTQRHKQNLEELSEAILEWCEKHSIDEELAEIRLKLFSIPDTHMGTSDPPPSGGANGCIKLLENALRSPKLEETSKTKEKQTNEQRKDNKDRSS